MSTTEVRNAGADDEFRTISTAAEALSVRRVFGEAYEVDGMTVIPVARVRGGGGGGRGEGPSGTKPEPGTKPETGTPSGSGSGIGFGLTCRPIGVYEVRNGRATWRPAIDATLVLQGMQVLAGLAVVCSTMVKLRRARSGKGAR